MRSDHCTLSTPPLCAYLLCRRVPLLVFRSRYGPTIFIPAMVQLLHPLLNSLWYPARSGRLILLAHSRFHAGRTSIRTKSILQTVVVLFAELSASVQSELAGVGGRNLWRIVPLVSLRCDVGQDIEVECVPMMEDVTHVISPQPKW